VSSEARMNCEQSLTQFARSAKLDQVGILNKRNAVKDPQCCARDMVQEIEDSALGNVLHVPEELSNDRSR
jgi:hypothetical protein